MDVWTNNWVKTIIQHEKGRNNDTSPTYKRWNQFLIVLSSSKNPRSVCSRMRIQDSTIFSVTESLSLSLSWIQSLFMGDFSLFIALMLQPLLSTYRVDNLSNKIFAHLSSHLLLRLCWAGNELLRHYLSVIQPLMREWWLCQEASPNFCSNELLLLPSTNTLGMAYHFSIPLESLLSSD